MILEDPTRKEPLDKLAESAKFVNVLKRKNNVQTLNGDILSSVFEIVFYRQTTKKGLEVFGIVDPANYETCALYQFEGRNPIINGELNLDNETPTKKGQQAAGAITTYALDNQYKAFGGLVDSIEGNKKDVNKGL